MKKIVFLIILALVVFLTVFAIRENKKEVSYPLDDKSKISTIPADKILNLSNQGLKSIPSYVFSKTELEELNVSDNSLTGAIQAEVHRLTKLKVLNASNNLMTGVPAEIGQLLQLEILDLSNNKLTGLPHELGKLISLKVLNLSGNDYSKEDLEIIKKTLPKDVKIIVD